MTSGLESGLKRAIDDFALWQGAARVTCGRLPPALLPACSRVGKLTPPEPTCDMLLKNLFGPSGGIMDHRLLEIIACPVCNGKLYYSRDKQELICKLDRGFSAA